MRRGATAGSPRDRRLPHRKNTHLGRRRSCRAPASPCFGARVLPPRALAKDGQAASQQHREEVQASPRQAGRSNGGVPAPHSSQLILPPLLPFSPPPRSRSERAWGDEGPFLPRAGAEDFGLAEPGSRSASPPGRVRWALGLTHAPAERAGTSTIAGEREPVGLAAKFGEMRGLWGGWGDGSDEPPGCSREVPASAVLYARLQRAMFASLTFPSAQPSFPVRAARGRASGTNCPANLSSERAPVPPL